MEEENVVSYKENPNLNLKVVETFNGTLEYRGLCKKVGGEYFIKGVDIVEVRGLWYRTDSGKVVFDHETKQWALKNMAIREGIVDYDGFVPVMGWFSINRYNNVDVEWSGNRYSCITPEVAAKFAVEAPGKGYYIAVREASPADLRIANYMDNRRGNYNADDDPNIFERTIRTYMGYEIPITKAVRKYSRYLEDTTFGTEIECIRGYMPTYILNRTGTIICRDGSLRDADETQGPEYTTVPYSGAKGVATLSMLTKEISKRNHISDKCAMHMHLGNLPTTRTFMVALYMLAESIQDELFDMFPYYKNDEVRFAGKNKNYCQKLSSLFMPPPREMDKESYKDFIEDSYLKIYKFLLESTYPNRRFNRKTRGHTKADKWNRHSRYYWINFINLISSNRDTVEFRLHTATSNPQKTITWLYICNAIVRTAMARSNDILRGHKLSIFDVLNYYRDTFRTPAACTISGYLIYYYGVRQSLFQKDFERGDFISQHDLQHDATFFLDYSFITDLFR